MDQLAIVVPSHNEENRIGKMLESYTSYFSENKKIDVTFFIVLNGCTDNTFSVVQEFKSKAHLIIIDLKEAGKGLAIKRGFQEALSDKADLIGFVDADMATKPEYFYELVEHLDNYDGIIGSRYMEGAKVFPPRPFIKEWGRRLIYQPLVRLLFGLKYNDFQCGAKIFRRKVIEKITPHLTVKQWAFDVEILYLCKKFGFKIREWPTIWYDQEDSKLRLVGPGSKMLSSLVSLRWRHSFQKGTSEE